MTVTLFDFTNRSRDKLPDALAPWQPAVLSREQWPPNYRGALLWRIQMLQKLRDDPALLAAAKSYYSTRPVEFICDWMDTYDPRRITNKWLPFVFFERQAEFIQMLDELRATKQSGLVEKCRDVGATWCCCAYAVHSWLFIPHDAIGFGSRKEQLVDKIGDPDSIFEKMRLLINRLPEIWRPKSYSTQYMKLVNQDNGSTVTGEAGDNIGRGGRKAIYFKDESAHYEHPEKIEAALGDNTDVQVDISSVNGVGNVFHRRREAGEIWTPSRKMDAGITRVFIFDYHDHPEKNQEWYNTRRAKYDREGMLHLFAQEVDRNYSAAVMNTIIPAEWLDACVDAHLKIRWKDAKGILRTGVPTDQLGNAWHCALDPADEGGDRNAFAARQSIIWRIAEEWGGERDPGPSTRKALDIAMKLAPRILMQYDSIGIGSAVKTEYNRLVDDKIIDPAIVQLVPWNAGQGVLNPFYTVIPDDERSPLNVDTFANLKAQAWLSFRTRAYKTFKNITEGFLYPIDELLSLDSDMPNLHQVKKELCQATNDKNTAMKIRVNKKPDGTKSPNLADAGIMMYFPLDPTAGQALTGGYGV